VSPESSSQRIKDFLKFHAAITHRALETRIFGKGGVGERIINKLGNRKVFVLKSMECNHHQKSKRRKKMKKIWNFLKGEDGLEVVEYAIILGLIVVGVIATVLAIGYWVSDQFADLNSQINP
jgi:pilus assembly protein Flp/PilA